jgi:CRISPR-associated protein Csm4
MTIRKLVRLDFGRSPTHFGDVGIGLEQTSERVRSDTLFSAWVSAYARIFGIKGENGLEALLKKFQEQPETPPFRVSSTFIYRWDGDKLTDFLPKLVQHPIGYPDEDLAFAKDYRKLNYLPLEVWQRWYQGTGFDPATDPDQLQKYDTSYKAACKRYELPKVSIDRTTRATNFYYTGLHQFDWRPKNPTPEDNSTVESLAGLYFLLELPEDDSSLESDLKAALEILGDEGMGGERSSGAGRFRILCWKDLPSQWAEVVNFKAANHYSLISLFWEKPPLPPDLLGPSARYGLQERGGWICSPAGHQLRRQRVRMFTEGSVFSKKPDGQLAKVTPPQFKAHDVFRSGIAFSLPVALPA